MATRVMFARAQDVWRTPACWRQHVPVRSASAYAPHGSPVEPYAALEPMGEPELIHGAVPA